MTQINAKIPQTHRLEDTIVKMSILSKEINRFKGIPSKIPKAFLEEIHKSIIKSIRNSNRTWTGKTKLKCTKFKVSHFLITKLNLSKQCGTGIKTETSRIGEVSEIKSWIYDQMIFHNGIK